MVELPSRGTSAIQQHNEAFMHDTLEPSKHFFASRLGQFLLMANVIGAVVYVIAASPSWAIPQERGLHSTTGEPFIWALSVLPILAAFTLLNLAWGAYICFNKG
jgi:hypothetical protein